MLVAEGQGAQRRRQGEGQQEVGAWHPLLERAFEPLLAFMVLTVWAAAMPARMRHQDPVVTGGALRQHRRTCRSAAILHGGQGLEMRWQERALILGQQLGLEALDDRGAPDHLAFPQSMEQPFISSLLTGLALFCVADVRWV